MLVARASRSRGIRTHTNAGRPRTRRRRLLIVRRCGSRARAALRVSCRVSEDAAVRMDRHLTVGVKDVLGEHVF